MYAVFDELESAFRHFGSDLGPREVMIEDAPELVSVLDGVLAAP